MFSKLHIINSVCMFAVSRGLDSEVISLLQILVLLTESANWQMVNSRACSFKKVQLGQFEYFGILMTLISFLF